MAAGAGRPGITPAQIAGVTLGNALEFYDFLVFGFFAVQIGRTFFPNPDPTSNLLAALATFGAGFLTRPLGAIVLGRMADRIGRKPTMLVSFAMIGAANLGLALIPSYAAIGIAAPLLAIACRLAQGFALGGEVGSSSAFLVEAAPPARRGVIVSLQFAGQGAATLVAGLAGTALAAALDDAALTQWGWRVAVALGVLILPIGLRLRGSLPETLDASAAAGVPPPLRRYARVAAIMFATMLSATVVTYVINYSTTFAQTVLKLGSTVAFGATVANGLGNIAGSLIGGLGADRYGRRPLIVWPMAAGAAGVLPGFWLMVHLPGAATLWPVVFALRLVLSVAGAAAFVHVVESLPARVRSGAVAIVYAVAISVFGGTTQFVIAWLIKVTGDPLAPAWYMLGAALLGLAAALTVRKGA